MCELPEVVNFWAYRLWNLEVPLTAAGCIVADCRWFCSCCICLTTFLEDEVELPWIKRIILCNLFIYQVCFNCLRKGHGYNFRKSKLRCTLCNGSHNALLCRTTPKTDPTRTTGVQESSVISATMVKPDCFASLGGAGSIVLCCHIYTIFRCFGLEPPIPPKPFPSFYTCDWLKKKERWDPTHSLDLWMKGLISLTHKYPDKDLFSTKPLIWPSAIPTPSELCPFVNLSLTEIKYCLFFP